MLAIWFIQLALEFSQLCNVHLLDEVSQCVHELTRNPDRKAEVEAISSYAYSYFNAEGHTIALN